LAALDGSEDDVETGHESDEDSAAPGAADVPR
jgi:hypothetical protein